MGLYAFIDSVMALVKMEHPTIAHKEIFGYNIWFGWVMILALLYSFIPAMILGRKKLPMAKKLHNKLLYVDADAQKADWMTAAAAIVGIIGIGFGLWWADAVAAIFISVSILKDGIIRSSDAITDFLGQIPTTIKKQEFHRLNKAVIELLEKEDWIKDFRIRLREEGEIFLGEAFVIAYSSDNLVEKITKCSKNLQDLDWKIYKIVIQPVHDFKVKDGQNNDG
jgi:divalent metal cation (Fe/Co/Zn/Cd) transporter